MRTKEDIRKGRCKYARKDMYKRKWKYAKEDTMTVEGRVLMAINRKIIKYRFE